MRFKYKCVVFESKGVLGGQLNAQDFQKELNKYGLQGWEVISITDSEHANGRTRETLVTMKKILEN